MAVSRMAKVLAVLVTLSAFLVFSLLLLFIYLWRPEEDGTQGVVKLTLSNHASHSQSADTETTDGGGQRQSVSSSADALSAFKATLLNGLARMNSKTFAFFLAALVVLFAALVLWQLFGPSASPAASESDSTDPAAADQSDSSSSSTWTPVYVIVALVVLLLIILAVIPLMRRGGQLIKSNVHRTGFVETSIECDSEFSPELRAKITAALGFGATIESRLKTCFEHADLTSISCLTNDASPEDRLALIKYFGQVRATGCMEWPELLAAQVAVSDTEYPGEVRLVDPSSLGGNHLEVVFASDFGSQLHKLLPKTIHLSHSEVGAFHVFMDNAGKFILAAKGDFQAAQVAAIVALQEVRAGCSVALGGKRLVESIQRGLRFFAPNKGLAFTLVQQSTRSSTDYVDVVQAGLLTVAIYSPTLRMISNQTAFPQDTKLTEHSTVSDVRFYRFEVSKNDRVFIYSSPVAFNLYPKVIAQQPFAVAIASRAAFVLANATTHIHIPYYADQDAKSVPLAPAECPEILVISKLIK